MACTGLLVGWRIRTPFLEALAGFLLLLFAYAISWVMAWVGLLVPTPEVVNDAGFMVIFPLTFVANTFVPSENLPSVLRTFADWNPVSSATQASRELFGNTNPLTPPPEAWSLQNPVLCTLLWVAMILAIFVPLSVRRYKRAANRELLRGAHPPGTIGPGVTGVPYRSVVAEQRVHVQDAGEVQVEVDVVADGRPATEALAARIAAAKSVHPLDPVTVIVPSNQAGLSVRRLLGSGRLGGTGIANVSFVTPFRLAELLGSTALGDRRPLTNPVLAAAARAVLADVPGMFEDVVDHQATQVALVELYGELSRALPETLAAIAGASRRGAEVVRLLEALRDRLADHHDEDDLARAAARRLVRDPTAATTLGTVVWHLPDRSSPAMADLLGAVLEAAPSSVVVGLTGAPEVDRTLVEHCRRAGVAIPLHELPTQPCAERVISAADPDEEVRTAIREVMALAEAGTDLDRIAIFLPAPDPYARTLLEQLDAAGIPHNGPATTRLADGVVGRTLLAALALPQHGWGRAEVAALLAGAPIRHGGRRAPAGRWDSVSRAAGVVGGLDDWQAKLAAHAAQLRAERSRLAGADGASEARLRRLADDAAAADDLARFVDDVAGRLAQLAGATTWAARSLAARQLLDWLLGPDHRRTGWPAPEVEAGHRVAAALARLVVLDEIEPSASWSTFEQAVRSELDARTGRTGRFGEGVLVAPLAASVGLDLDAVLVLGMVEGTCPSSRRDDTLLPDSDRRRAAGGELVTREQRLVDQHRTYLAALAAGRRHRTLLLPRGDLRGRRSRLASRWALDSVERRTGTKVFSSDVADLPGEVVEVVASYADGVGRAAVHGSATDFDVGALLRHVAAGGRPDAHPLVTGALARGFACLRSREGTAFTAWDGNLGGQVLPSPTAGDPVSPSRLETWASCPFRYFLAHVLRLDDRDEPEEIVEIGALDLGRLVHAVLEDFIGEVIARDGGPPAPAEPWTAGDRARIAEIAEQVFARYEDAGLTGRPLLWRRTKAKVLHDLDAFLTADDAHRSARGVRPRQVEMPFGLHGEAPLVLELADGRTLAFRGYADRVDHGDGGRLAVLDYKSGKDRYGAALEADPVQAGTTLQLGVYAEAAAARFAADDVEAHYWMATSAGGFAQRGYRWDGDRRTRFLDVVATIVDGIESGTFPSRPGPFDSFFGAHQNCGHCPFDRVCPRDRDDHERAKVDAPELSLLGRLAAPAREEVEP